MIIKKVLNNNGFISVDENGTEIIVTGRGIAYGMHAGSETSVPASAKIFAPRSQEVGNQLQKIVSDIPLEYLGITEYVVNMLRKEYDINVHDILYVSLTEHIHGAVERFLEGIDIQHPLLMEIRRIYHDEYQVASRCLEYISEKLHISFPEDEAGYIVYHIVNAELNGNGGNIAELTRLTQEILNIVKYQMRIEFSENSLQYDRFVTHLKYFVQRILNGSDYQSEDDEIYRLVKEKYPKSYICSEKIQKLIEKKYNYTISNEEKGYLILHIEWVANPR